MKYVPAIIYAFTPNNITCILHNKHIQMHVVLPQYYCALQAGTLKVLFFYRYGMLLY